VSAIAASHRDSRLIVTSITLHSSLCFISLYPFELSRGGTISLLASATCHLAKTGATDACRHRASRSLIESFPSFSAPCRPRRFPRPKAAFLCGSVFLRLRAFSQLFLAVLPFRENEFFQDGNGQRTRSRIDPSSVIDN